MPPGNALTPLILPHFSAGKTPAFRALPAPFRGTPAPSGGTGYYTKAPAIFFINYFCPARFHTNHFHRVREPSGRTAAPAPLAGETAPR